jgi:hypothetical protein
MVICDINSVEASCSAIGELVFYIMYILHILYDLLLKIVNLKLILPSYYSQPTILLFLHFEVDVY